MAQLIVNVPLLNKRSVIPASLPDADNIIGQVQEGFRFEGTQVPSADLPNPSPGIWYKDRDGYFYWGGGVVEIQDLTSELSALEAAPAEAFDPAKMSWGHQRYEIPFIWEDIQTRGDKVLVAVIDTGIDAGHDDLKDNIDARSKSFVGGDANLQDTAGHGTQMAGIIGANGKSKVFGVAPETKLLIVRGTDKTNNVDLSRFAQAIVYAASIPEVDIISISYSFIKNDPNIQTAIQTCLTNNKIVVSAIGNQHNPLGTGEDMNTFPAAYNSGPPDHSGPLAVGAFDQQGQLCTFSNWSRHLSFLAPGDNAVKTTGLNNTVINGSQTSIATAFVSGSMALMLSYLKKNKPHQIHQCIPCLLESCDDIGSVTGFEISSGFGRMHLRNAIAKLKNL